MDVLSAITKMEEAESVNDSELSRRLGKSRNYMSVTRSKNSDIGASNLAKMANAMGWRLMLAKDGLNIEVTPRD